MIFLHSFTFAATFQIMIFFMSVFIFRSFKIHVTMSTGVPVTFPLMQVQLVLFEAGKLANVTVEPVNVTMHSLNVTLQLILS